MISSTLLISLLVIFVALTTIVVDAGTNEAGLAFLAENKNKTGVVTLPSGLQYKVLNEGNGTEHPTIDSPCQVNYEGQLIDGTVFDSSYARGEPSTFAPNQVIEGWTEAMQMMVVGDKWELYIPSELAYGDRGYPPVIPGGDVLIFQMELLDIQGGTIPATIAPTAYPTSIPTAAPTMDSNGCYNWSTAYFLEYLTATTAIFWFMIHL